MCIISVSIMEHKCSFVLITPRQKGAEHPLLAVLQSHDCSLHSDLITPPLRPVTLSKLSPALIWILDSFVSRIVNSTRLLLEFQFAFRTMTAPSTTVYPVPGISGDWKNFSKICFHLNYKLLLERQRETCIHFFCQSHHRVFFQLILNRLTQLKKFIKMLSCMGELCE